MIFAREEEKNLGDVIIGDTCRHVLEGLSQSWFHKAEIETMNLLAEEEEIRLRMQGKDTVVFAGGGINSMHFCDACERILRCCDDSTEIYFNAVGVAKSEVNMSPKIRKRLRIIFRDPRVKQITTRGDYETAVDLIEEEKEYPCRLVLDPAIWTGETYGIHRDAESQVIGIGLIRPDLFETYEKKLDVERLYVGLVESLERRGYRWKLFCNGSYKDYIFGKELCAKMDRPADEFFLKRPMESKKLVRQIASFQGIIAGRFHANIIATSLEIPSVALVWNEKMRGFCELIDCPERYVGDEETLMDAEKMVDLLEKAMEEGYDRTCIRKQKRKTRKTMKNILR
ncbi:MAG: polysaccharide pyruvyl transferase family protein [Lachnospiraceae bacterium]|nr:polysaccharide pyruvyl transferase family protein [Lachnospiraceae bacterium]